MFLVKHCKQELYFGKREIINGYLGDMTLTSNRDEAKIYHTLKDVLNAIEWFDNEDYVPEIK